MSWWWWFSCSAVSDSCNPMDCSRPGSSVHGNLHARMLEQVAISISRGSSWPRNQAQVSSTAGRFFTSWAVREAQLKCLRIEKSCGGFFMETTDTWAGMTQRLHSAGVVDQECLHVASPCGLGLLRAQWPQGSSFSYKVAQESRNIPEKKVDSVTFSGLASLLLYSICWSRHKPIRFNSKVLRCPLQYLNEGRHCKLKRLQRLL